MSAKLYLEAKAPHRGILIITDVTDFIECKAIGGQYNYLPSSNNRKGTYSGELRVKDIEFEMIDDKVVDSIKKSLDFPSLEAAEAFMEKIHSVIPEEKEDFGETDTTKKVLKLVKATGSGKGLTEIEPGVHEVTDVEAIVAEAERTGIIQPKSQPSRGGKKNKKKNKFKKIDQTNLKSEYNNKIAKEKSQASKEEKTSERKVPNDIKEKIEVKNTLGYIDVNMKLYPKGYFLGHAYKDPKGNPCMLMVGHPAPTQHESRIMIFAEEKHAKFTHESLLRHPRHQKLVGQAVPHPISEIPEGQRNIDSVLIVDPAKYVNALEQPEK